MGNITILGIDIAKHVFHIAGMNDRGKVVLRKKLYREELCGFIANFPITTIGIEACGGAHHWGRTLGVFGHEVKLIAPRFVKPYVKSNKNDSADAEAICEAVSRENMRFVAIKKIEQQDWQALHRIRERLVKSRTALGNQIRGILAERGIILPQSISAIREELSETLRNHQDTLSSTGLELIKELHEEFFQIDSRILSYEKKLEAISKSHPECQRLQTIPGIGPITAVALISCAPNVSNFKNGRQFAASLGLVPRQHSTGGKNTLLGISKRGDTYLRKLLIHGARAVMRYRTTKADKRNLWLQELVTRRGFHRATVVLANKNARTVWALLLHNTEFKFQESAA